LRRWLQLCPTSVRKVPSEVGRARTEPMTEATRGCGSAPGMKREVVLWAAQRPTKASAMIVECMLACKLGELSRKQMCELKVEFTKMAS
jgi:hypothetical protein